MASESKTNNIALPLIGSIGLLARNRRTIFSLLAAQAPLGGLAAPYPTRTRPLQ